jgi:hypothetical protein
MNPVDKLSVLDSLPQWDRVKKKERTITFAYYSSYLDVYMFIEQRDVSLF